MTTQMKFTDTQRQVLECAIAHPDGAVIWFPEQLKAGAIAKVTQALLHKGLIAVVEGRSIVTDAGYAALGQAKQPTADAHQALDKSATSVQHEPRQVRSRHSSKQATVIEMLKRPEGATIDQICAATSWQSHTVRGTFANTIKKKLGLNLTSVKADAGERVYRVN